MKRSRPRIGRRRSSASLDILTHWQAVIDGAPLVCSCGRSLSLSVAQREERYGRYALRCNGCGARSFWLRVFDDGDLEIEVDLED